MAKIFCALLTTLVTFASFCDATIDDACFRMTAAFNYDDNIYLIDDDKYIKIDSNFAEEKSGEVDKEFDFDGDIDAATDYKGDKLYFFQGNNYYRYWWFWGSIGSATENSNWNGFFDGGVDASGRVNGHNYYFKGCKYLNEQTEEEADIKTLGLPCDVDAAWYQGGKMYVTKGDNFWTLDDNLKVEGPHKLYDLLKLTSVQVCREAENPYLAKIRAEQKYEAEHNCTIVDAAITWEDAVYLFNNDEYVKLDAEGIEVEREDIFDWGGMSGNVDAAVVWSGNDATYFFKGPGYYRYFYNYFGGITFGPMSNDKWDPFLEENVDAAGNHNGNLFLFKDDKLALYNNNNNVSSIIQNEDLNLPTHVDAAFSRADTLYVIKRNQVWTWSADKEMATGPEPLSSVATLTSWTACAP